MRTRTSRLQLTTTTIARLSARRDGGLVWTFGGVTFGGVTFVGGVTFGR
jgi:hypothetical protein